MYFACVSAFAGPIHFNFYIDKLRIIARAVHHGSTYAYLAF